MFLKPTPQLLQQIKDSGKPIIQITMEEFQKMASMGKLLTTEEAMEKLKLSNIYKQKDNGNTINIPSRI